MAQRIEPQLKEHGCDMSSNQYQVFVDGMFKEHAEYKTVDEMLLHTDDAKAFCNTVRGQGREFSALPDHLILGPLMAYRKSGKSKK